jgi:hypothetical protein
MGNRESSSGGKYSVLLGRLEFFDAKGTIIYLQVGIAEIPYETQVPYKDIDYVLFFPVSNVRTRNKRISLRNLPAENTLIFF